MERTIYVVLDELKNEARKLAIGYAKDAQKAQKASEDEYYTGLSQEHEARVKVLEAVILELPDEVLERLAE